MSHAPPPWYLERALGGADLGDTEGAIAQHLGGKRVVGVGGDADHVANEVAGVGVKEEHNWDNRICS